MNAIDGHETEFRDLARNTNFADEIALSQWGGSCRSRSIHTAKIHDHLRESIVSLGLAHEIEDWLITDDRLACIYMCALAEEIARSNQLHPATDAEYFYVAASDWTPERISTALLAPQEYVAPRNVGAHTLGLLAVQAVLPREPGRRFVSPEAYVKIRKRYGAEFQAFQSEVDAAAEDLIPHLTEIEDAVMLEAYLRDEVERRFTRPAEELRKALHGLGYEVVTTSITTRVEVPGGLMAAGVLAGQTLIAGLTAVAAALLQVYGTASRRRKELMRPAGTPSGISYLYRMGRYLAAPAAISRVTDGLRAFGRRYV